jgi:hypothetical protein
MTELVADAERCGWLPPMRVSQKELSSSRRKPTLLEIKAAIALTQRVNLMVRAFETRYYFVYPRDRRPHYEPEHPQRMPEWRTRVQKAFYRVFIVGAALAGAYNEPVVKLKSEFGVELGPGTDTDSYPIIQLSEKELKFLEQFAVCNMNATPEAYEAVFGPVGDWLLETIMADKVTKRQGKPWPCASERGVDEPGVANTLARTVQ